MPQGADSPSDPRVAAPPPGDADRDGVVELLEAAEDLEGSRPRPPPPPGEAVAPPKPEAPEETSPWQLRDFWAFAEQALGRIPDPDEGGAIRESFPIAYGADRATLATFAAEALTRFGDVPEARAIASLSLLLAAVGERERHLLGANRQRVELIRRGLSLFVDPAPAARAAVFVETDGEETRDNFAKVVDLIVAFLGFCLREGLDPMSPDAAARFSGRA